MRQLKSFRRFSSYSSTSNVYARSFADNGYKYRGILAGKFEGVVQVPLNIVWARTHDFFDFSWATDAYQSEKLEDNIRKMTQLDSVVYEKLLKKHQSQDLCYHIYDVKVKNAGSPAMTSFFRQIDSITNTTQFRALDDDRTLFQFFSYYDGPQNSIKYYRDYFNDTYKAAYTQLNHTYTNLDINLSQMLSSGTEKTKQQAQIAMTKPEYYHYEPGLVDKINGILYDSVHQTRAPVKAISFPPVFKTMGGMKMAEAIPSSNDIIKPKKAISLLAGFAQPTFDAYANMLASDSSFYTAAVSDDPWLNFDFFIPGYESTPFTVNQDVVDRFKQHPDEIFAQYFLNGGNPNHIERPGQLGVIPYWRDFANDPYVGQEIKDILKVNELDKNTNLQSKIYLGDYTYFEKYEYPQANKGMYCHGCVALFGEKDGKVLPLGIRFNVPKVINENGQWDYLKENGKEVTHRVFNPKTTPPNIWKFAKMHVNHNDLNLYQFIYHLGNGHLGSEILSLGSHNHFRAGTNKNHPLLQIMASPVEGLIGINHFAGVALIDPAHALTNDTFGPGTLNCVDLFGRYSQEKYKFDHLGADTELALRGFLKHHPNIKSPPAFDILSEIEKARAGNSDLVKVMKYSDYLQSVNADEATIKKAGRDGLLDKELILDADGYQYRLDALWLYQLIYNHVQEVIHKIYPDDISVKRDSDLQKYEEFLKLNSPRFDTTFETRDDVTRHVATLWWVCTGYHAPSFSVRDFETYPPFRPTLINKPMPLFNVEEDLTQIDLDLALIYPKKHMLIKILIGGVTEQTGTPYLGEEAIVTDVAQQLYFKQAWAHLEEHGLHLKADLIESNLYKNEHEARVHFDTETAKYVQTVQMIAMLYTELKGLKAKHSKGKSETAEKVKDVVAKSSSEDEILAQIEHLKEVARAEIERVPKALREHLDQKLANVPNEDVAYNLSLKVDQIIKDAEDYLAHNFDMMERTAIYQNDYFKLYQQLQVMGSNIDLRNYHVPKNQLKFPYLHPKRVPSSLSA